MAQAGQTHPPHRHKHSVLLILLASIGTMAVGGVVLDLFLGVGRRPHVMQAAENPAAGSADFLLSVAGTLDTPLRAGGGAELLINGDAFYPALLQAIHAAQRSVNFSAFIWDERKSPQPSQDVAAALMERARAGVAVRVLLDAYGARGMKDETREAMRAAGVRVSQFRPLRFGMLTRFYRRNHRRAIVMDGRVAFTGGMAVAPQWLGNAQDEEHWRDTMVVFSGPPATGVQSAFADAWAYSTGELLAGDAFFPAWPALPMDAAPVPADGAAADAGPFIHTGLASAPSKEDHPLALLLLLTFNGARQRLWITTPYFIPDETMRRALVERASRGVDVRLLLPGDKTDAPPVRLAAQRHYEELLRGGVRIFEYQPTMLHSKSIVADGVWSVVGSANMNVRSRELDHENVVAVSNRGFARKLEDVFTHDLTRAREIRYEEWARRGRWQRLKERLCSAMAQVS